MIDAIEETWAFPGGIGFKTFRDDPRTLKAMLGNLSVVGEAAGTCRPRGGGRAPRAAG